MDDLENCSKVTSDLFTATSRAIRETREKPQIKETSSLSFALPTLKKIEFESILNVEFKWHIVSHTSMLILWYSVSPLADFTCTLALATKGREKSKNENLSKQRSEQKCQNLCLGLY